MYYSIAYDFSIACDTVWREKLLLSMIEASICWLCSFLTGCRARVQFHNVCSSSIRFIQGLPQGSVLAPLLFLFYINILPENLSNNAIIVLFEGNVSILITAHKKEDAIVAAKSEVARVSEGSCTCKPNLNADKSEMLPFFHLV